MSLQSYEEKTREIVKRFCLDGIDFAACITALDTALATLIPTLVDEQVPQLRGVMLANNNVVMMEMDRRARRNKWVN